MIIVVSVWADRQNNSSDESSPTPPSIDHTPSFVPITLPTIFAPPIFRPTPVHVPYAQPCVQRGECSCDDFDTWTAAKGVFDLDPSWGVFDGLDEDGDGIPCESLPGAP